ncbi:MAG: mucoidy inhibitor MuiA family protein [Candidatus Kapaibacterium sp.]
MKRIFGVMMSLVAVTCVFAAEPKPISSKIDAVTVYQDRALVSRTGRISLPVGVYTVAFEGLPYGLDDNSVRVSGEAVGAAILDIQVKATTSVPPLPDSVQAARRKKYYDKVEELEALRADNNDKINIINTQKAFLDQIKIQTGASINEQLKLTRPTADDWQKFVDFYGGNSQKLTIEQRKYERQNAELRIKIDSLRQLANSNTQSVGSKQVKTVLVELDVTRSGEIELNTSYVVQGASWTPVYDLRVQKATKDVQLDYRASIRQYTGEDWTNVALTLSTARPDVGGNQPLLGTWTINGSEPPKQVAIRSQSEDSPLSPGSVRGTRSRNVVTQSSVASADSYSRVNTDFAPVTQALARIESDYYSTMFDIPSKATIPSDNIAHKVMITKLKLASEFGYSCTPKLSLNVYLKATIKNTSDTPILPGTMSIFSDRDYISQSSLPFISPSETFAASIGVDPSITIHRSRLTETKNTGVFTKNRVLEYKYQYVLQNNRKKDTIQVEVLDQMPVSQHEKIVIEQLEPTVKDNPVSPQGVITWKHTLKPNEKKDWKLHFSIEYPVDFSMQGLSD